MRTATKLLRGITATVLGLTLSMSATPAPARAADGVDYQAFIQLLHGAFEKGRDGYSPAEVNELIQQVIGAIQGTEADLLTRLNTELTNEIWGSTQAALTKVEMLTVPWLAGPVINSTHDAAYLAKAHLATVKDSDVALDAVGRAMIALFNYINAAYIAVDADEGSRFAPTQRPFFREGLEYLIQEMTPACVPGGQVNTGLTTYTCTFGGRTVRAQHWALTDTYTIDGSGPIPGPIDRSIVVEIVMRDTVWQLARQTLDVLVREGVRLPQ